MGSMFRMVALVTALVAAMAAAAPKSGSRNPVTTARETPAEETATGTARLVNPSRDAGGAEG